jgi:hypothetical protein
MSKMRDNANIPVAKSTPFKEDDEYVLPDPEAPLGAMPGLSNLVVPHGVQLTRRRRGARGAGNSLPVLNSEPHVHMTFRYKRVGTGGEYSVTVGDVANCIVAAASTTSYRYIMRTFRIKHVTLRGSSGAVGDDASIGLRFVGQNTNEIRLMDQTLKIDENAYVSRAPPRMSLASFWHDVESSELSTEIFSVNYFGSGEFFVDMAIEFLIDVDRYITYALSGGTALQTGGIYKGPLSGTSTDGLVAVGGVRLQ